MDTLVPHTQTLVLPDRDQAVLQEIRQGILKDELHLGEFLQGWKVRLLC